MKNIILSEVCNNDIINGKFIIPNYVTKIGYGAFRNCNNLISITIPDSVTEIKDYAFDNCHNLKSIIIPDSVTEIDDMAFAHCYNLKDITISNSITKIKHGTFYKCNELQSKLGNYKAFEKGLICKNMQYISNEWNKIEGDIKLCNWGLHYVTNLFDIFTYYDGDLENDIEIWEVEVGDIVIGHKDYSKIDFMFYYPYDSKKVTNAIKPIKRLNRQEIIDILNNK